MMHQLKIQKVSRLGKEKGKLCTACYDGYGIIWDGKNFKIDKCLFCNQW